MTRAELIDPMRAFIEERHLDGGGDLTVETPLLEWALLDSFTLVELVQFIEERFGIDVPNELVTPANFGTLGDIAVLVEGLIDERGDR